MSNNFLPFCPNDTGTNLESQSDYAAATDRTNGNQPGVARSKLVNKALRQATYVVGQFAQYISDLTGTDALDDATPAKLLAQTNASLLRIAPVITKYTSSSGTHNVTYNFFIATGSATAAATYTNNGVTYTVVTTVASGLQIKMTGNGAPTTSGTLTKASGTGDATLTFYAVRAPLFLKVKLVGAGGGGGGSGTTAGTAATDGGASTFGTALLSAGGGLKGARNNNGGTGGTSSLGTGPVGLALTGASGGAGPTQGSSPTTYIAGGIGGSSAFGGSGSGGTTSNAGQPGVANTGGGGGGAFANTTTSDAAGSGGGSGGYVEATINTPLSTYAYAVGTGGSGQLAGTSGAAGGAGGSGLVYIEEHYQ